MARNTYSNSKVDALLDATAGTFTPNDFLDLALACLDQGGLPASVQAALAHIIDEYRPDCEHRDATGEQCDLAMGHRGRHGFACDDGGCCEPTDNEIDLNGEGAAARAHALDLELRSAGRI